MAEVNHLSHPFITIQHHIACMIWYRMTWDAVQLWSLVPSTHIGLHYRSTSRLPYMISTISDQQIGNKTWKYYCTSSESCPTTWSQSASRHYTFIFFPPGISPEASPLLWDRRYADLCCAAIGSDPTAGMERQGCKYLHEDECHEDENSQTRYAKWYWIDVLKKNWTLRNKILEIVRSLHISHYVFMKKNCLFLLRFHHIYVLCSQQISIHQALDQRQCITWANDHPVDCYKCITRPEWVNLLWPGDAIWCQRSRSTLVEVMACCLTALSSHYPNQRWLLVNKVLWH